MRGAGGHGLNVGTKRLKTLLSFVLCTLVIISEKGWGKLAKTKGFQI